MAQSSEPADLALLQAMSQQYRTAAAAGQELAARRAELLLAMPAIHVISDVHGEAAKLRHVINNASGRLRPLVDRLFTSRLVERERQELLAVLYYPREQMQHLRDWLNKPRRRRQWVSGMLRRQFEMIREMSGQRRLSQVTVLIEPGMRELFEELLTEPLVRWESAYIDEMLAGLEDQDLDLAAVRAASHLVRNLAYGELIVAGDLGDRGPRIDQVIDYLRQQHNVAIVWGNHDAHWMGACLGQEALIASVLRFSLKHGRLAQLEEGYGIPLEPLEKLAREIYGKDPCQQFATGGEDLRDAQLLRRMHKAAAILQFKLDAQTAARHPDWHLENRNLLSRVDLAKGTVAVDGKTYPLLDKNFPTLQKSDPSALSPAEKDCLGRLRESFITSPRLWEHMHWVTDRGHMWLRRDSALIFHGCVAVDSSGKPLKLNVDGKERSGRELMDALDGVVRRAFRAGARDVGQDADWFWYLWSGPRSPLFGKDKLAAFEGYFIADAAAKRETKNPYFQLINDAKFCVRIGKEFGMPDDVLIVNGHMPVKIEAGENPLKKGGNAVTIDGAFSESYGDRGFTLILDAAGITLAEHAHFQSVQQMIEKGTDMVPKLTAIRNYDPPRTCATTDRGNSLRGSIAALERLIAAYRNGQISEAD
jgi:fructose-1,6-bisphosphatase III